MTAAAEPHLRIIQVCPTLSVDEGGPTVAVIELSRALRELGHEVLIATTDAEATDSSRPRVDVTELSHRVGDAASLRVHRALPPKRLKLSPGLWRRLRHEIAHHDVVHVHELYSFSTWAAVREAQRAGVPHVVHPHGVLEPYHRVKSRQVKRLWDLTLGRRTLRDAAAVVVATDREAESVADLVPAERVRVVSFGAGETPTAVNRGSSEFADLLARPTVLFLGRITAKKRIDLLLAAWSLVVAELPDALLVVAGSGDRQLEEALRRQAVAVPNDRVRFLGTVSGARKQDLLSAADLFVLPSESESFALAVGEALSAGLPVLISHEVALADLISEHGAGLVLDDLTGDRLAAAILSLLTDPTELARRSMNAQRLASSALSWQTCAERHVAIYTQSRTSR